MCKRKGGRPDSAGGARCLGDTLLAQLGMLPGGPGLWGGHIHLPLELGLSFHTLSSTSPRSSTVKGWGGCNAPTKGGKATHSLLAVVRGRQLLSPHISAEK